MLRISEPKKPRKCLVTTPSVEEPPSVEPRPPLPPPPRVVIESDTGDREEIRFDTDKVFDSGNDSDEGGGAATEVTNPLLPRPALKKSPSLGMAEPEEPSEAYRQRKRPSIAFALEEASDEDRDSDRSDEANGPIPNPALLRLLGPGSARRGSLGPPQMTEEVGRQRSKSQGNLIPLSVRQIERTASQEISDTETGSLKSENGPPPPVDPARRPSRLFTVINYGGVQPPPTNSGETSPSSRRPSVQYLLPAITVSPEEMPSRANSTIGSQHSVLSSRVRKSLAMEANSPHNSLPRLSQPDVLDGYSRLAGHRGSVFTQTGLSIPQVAKRGQMFAQRRKQRLVNKAGDFNISYRNIHHRHFSYMADIFTTVLDMKWRYTILIFIVTFCTSWVTFGLMWWLIAHIRGDHKDKVEQNCVSEVFDFPSALLFSVETQHTIGYGVRAMTANCPEAVLLLMVQSLFGVIVQCVMAGFVLAKLARPKYRAETIMFSKNAVICQEDGEYCLLFRVGDMRRSQLVGAMLHAMFVKKRVTQEGDEIPFYQYHLEVSAESEDYDQFIFLSWPIRVMHRINRASPLWGVDAEQLLTEDFEIIVVLEGVVEATGMTTQVRTSYLPSEILWGHRLAPLLTFRLDNGSYEIDYGRFHETRPVDMPEQSAAVMADVWEREAEEEEHYGSRRTLISSGQQPSHRTTVNSRRGSYAVPYQWTLTPRDPVSK